MQIMVVLQLPPSESSRMRVSLESRYGMCVRSRRSVNAPITLPAMEVWSKKVGGEDQRGRSKSTGLSARREKWVLPVT